MKKPIICLILIATSIIAPLIRLLPATALSPTPCSDIEFVWVRGSGQSADAGDYLAYQRAIHDRLSMEGALFSYSFSEIDYPAVAIHPSSIGNILTATGGWLTSGEGFNYGSSVDTGVTALLRHINGRKVLCPDTKYSLGGLSQGAQVVGDSLWHLYADDIIYVALFGDPKLYLPEGIGINPPACQGQRSSYNVWSPNCHTHEGILQSRIPYIPPKFDGRVGLWCNSRDLICGSSTSLTDFSFDADGHGEYKTNGQMRIMANLIWQRLKDYSPIIFPDYDDTLVPNSQAPMDIAFIFDSTGSMVPFIQSYRDSAAKLAKEVIERGGRIALIEYRDYENYSFPRLRCSFDCTLDRFVASVNNITASSGGDTPEALLQALMFSYNNLDWRSGATKSAIVLTDAGYHNPDKSGITYDQVVARSLEIDPVNTYIFANRNQWFTPEFEFDLAHLASDTGGFSIVLDSKADNLSDIFNSAHQQIGRRPVAVLPQEFYSGTTQDIFVFDAGLSYANQAQITQYEFDFNGDGVYDFSSATPSATHNYDYPDDYTIIIRITDSTSKTATISAPVYVTLPDAPHETNPINPEAASIISSSPSARPSDHINPISPDALPIGLDSEPSSTDSPVETPGTSIYSTPTPSVRTKPLFDTTLRFLTIVSFAATILVTVLLVRQPKRSQLLSKGTT